MALFLVTLSDPNYPKPPPFLSQTVLKRLNRWSSFCHRGFSQLILHSVGREFGYLQKIRVLTVGHQFSTLTVYICVQNGGRETPRGSVNGSGDLLPARRYASVVLAVVVCPSVCLSVCVSVYLERLKLETLIGCAC